MKMYAMLLTTLCANLEVKTMRKTTFPVQDVFCRSCGSKMYVDDIDDSFGRETNVYYGCPKCSMSLIRFENYQRVEFTWFDGDTQTEERHVVSKFKGRKYNA